MKYSFLQSQFFYPLRQKIIPCKNNLIFKSILKSKHSNTCWASMGLLLFPYFSSVQFSRSVMSDSLRPHGLQHARLPCSSPSPGVCSDSCPLNWWCHPRISSSVVPFSSFLQSFPASGSFPMTQFFASGGQSTGVSASASVSPSNEYSGLISFRIDWFYLLAVQGTLKSLLQHHSSKASIFWHTAFFRVQLSHPYMTTGKTIALTIQTFVGKEDWSNEQLSSKK